MTKRNLNNSNLFCVDFGGIVPGSLNINGIGEKLINCHWSANCIASPFQSDFSGHDVGAGNIKISDVFFILDNDALPTIITLFQLSTQIVCVTFIVVRKDHGDANSGYVRNVEIKYYSCVLTAIYIIDINSVMKIMANGLQSITEMSVNLISGRYDLQNSIEIILDTNTNIPTEQLSHMYILLAVKYNMMTTDVKRFKEDQIIGNVRGDLKQPGVNPASSA